MPTKSKDAAFAEEMEGSLDRIVMGNATLDNAIAWIDSNLDPDEVFDQKKLEAWAESNGYVKE